MTAKRAGAYVRAMNWELAQEKIASQAQDIREWAELNGYEVVEVYADLGPGNSAQRPAFQRMMADANAGRIEAVIVVDLARLFRDMTLLMHHLDQMSEQLHEGVIAVNLQGGEG